MSEAAAGKVTTRKDGAVGYVTFDNPSRLNAMSYDMWEQTEHAFLDFEKDDAIRVVVLSGAGDKAFVSGADISKFGAERASQDGVARYNAQTDRAYAAVANFKRPTIAMIRGYCVGGGMGLALCCDLRISNPGARFAVPAAKLGLGYEFTGMKRLADVVGPSFAKEIFYTARQFDAEEARVMGLVNRIVPDAELSDYVQKYAATISGNAPMTVASVKLIVGEILRPDSERNLAACDAAVKACFDSADYVEGRTAFMEKRKPAFKGR